MGENKSFDIVKLENGNLRIVLRPRFKREKYLIRTTPRHLIFSYEENKERKHFLYDYDIDGFNQFNFDINKMMEEIKDGIKKI